MFLVPLAAHLIPEDGSAAPAEGSAAVDAHGPAAPQLPAHDVGVGQVPGVVAHRAPGTLLLYLHPTFAPAPAAGQPQHAGTWVRRRERGYG